MELLLEHQETLESLELRLRTVLPEEYQDSYEDVEPVSMGSASLKYLSNGKVAWNEIWATFCDLAMAGGPPHKGTFLEAGTAAEIAADPERYNRAVREICRGVEMATGLSAEPSLKAGWVRVECGTRAAAGWLARAIVMENISARCEGTGLELPAGPAYRVHKEIKNVVTSIAKTYHYWGDHIWEEQQQEITELFERMEAETPLVVPSAADGDVEVIRRNVGAAIYQATGLRVSNHPYSDWLGLECGEVGAAIWMMRALVVSNILSRREETVLFVPINPVSDPEGARVMQAVVRIFGFWSSRSRA